MDARSEQYDGFIFVVYGMPYTGMHRAVFFRRRGRRTLVEVVCNFSGKSVFIVVIFDVRNWLISMAVQEDVLRIKKSLEKMMLNKSVVFFCITLVSVLRQSGYWYWSINNGVKASGLRTVSVRAARLLYPKYGRLFLTLWMSVHVPARVPTFNNKKAVLSQVFWV